MSDRCDSRCGGYVPPEPYTDVQVGCQAAIGTNWGKCWAPAPTHSTRARARGRLRGR